jgi:hypothetical protein
MNATNSELDSCDNASWLLPRLLIFAGGVIRGRPSSSLSNSQSLAGKQTVFFFSQQTDNRQYPSTDVRGPFPGRVVHWSQPERSPATRSHRWHRSQHGSEFTYANRPASLGRHRTTLFPATAESHPAMVSLLGRTKFRISAGRELWRIRRVARGTLLRAVVASARRQNLR